MQEGMNYNMYFPGHQIAMPKPLNEGQITYADGTPNTVEQMAHDVVTFLTWAANPEMVERKQIGVRAVLFMLLMTGLTYAVKRKVWAEVDAKDPLGWTPLIIAGPSARFITESSPL